MSNDLNRAKKILSNLMHQYTTRVPDVKKILNALIEKRVISSIDDIQNDHVAFRTLGVKHLGIESLEKIFIPLGYTKRDHYNFEKKKLDAYWFSPPHDTLPRLFISEIRVHELSKETQKIIHKYTDTVTTCPASELDLNDIDAVNHHLHSSPWGIPTLEEYNALLEESEYAAWAIYNRYYLNHFTVSVHTLPKGYSTLEEFNAFVESLGIKLNDAGGKIKVSRDTKLRQSSTVAEMVTATFPNNDGETDQKEIAGSYVEFAERLPLDEFSDLSPEKIKREHRREGFEAQNADKIFESTYTDQMK